MISMLDDLDDDDEPDSDDDDLIGLLDDEDDLIGDTDTSSERTSIEAVISRVRRSIEKAKDGDDLIRRVEVIRGFPATDFTALHRERVVGDIQRKFKELTDRSEERRVAKEGR